MVWRQILHPNRPKAGFLFPKSFVCLHRLADGLHGGVRVEGPKDASKP